MGKSNTKKKVVVMGKVNLDRFAGSSDDDDDVEDDVESDQEEDEVMKAAAGGGGGRHDDNADVEDDESDADDSSDNDEGAQVENENDDDTDNDDIPPDEFVVDSKTKASSSKKGTTTSTPKDDEDDDSSSMEGGGTEHDPSSRMADAMGKILGTLTTTKSNKKGPSTVVLAKTVTPLQKLQQQEKEKQRQMTEKRQASRERNLSALHLPRSIATTNNVFSDGQQQLSVVKELEQERYHRRVATRGVVALFNAISQHQRTGGHTETESNSTNPKRKETTKLTKHGFLDKIKSAAKATSQGGGGVVDGGELRTNERDQLERRRDNNKDTSESTNKSSWNALKDDYMLNPKKNWDEESSDEEDESPIMEDPDMMEKAPAEAHTTDSKRKRQKRVSRE